LCDEEKQSINLDTTTSPTEENGMDTEQSFPMYAATTINNKLLELTESMAQINAAQERDITGDITRLDAIENQFEIT
jgi:hypothetical protein